MHERPLKRVDSEACGGDGGALVRRPWGIIAHLVFWSWNGLLATIALFGLLPVLGFAFVRDSVDGTVPPSLLLALVGLIALPVASIVVGFRVRRDPWRLLALFYGIEVPLLVVGIVRLFFVRELTTQLAAASIVALVGLASFAASMLMRRPRGYLAVGLFAGVGVLGLVTLGFASLAALYAIPTLVTVLREMSFSGFIGHPEIVVYLILGTALILYTSTLAVASPVLASIVYVVAVKRLGREALQQVGALRLALATVSLAALAIVVLHVSAIQPHTRAFALLSQTPASDAERTALLAKSDAIRHGLVDAYLAPYRYVAATGEETAIANLYAERFGGAAEDYALVGRFNDFMVAPFLFDAATPNAEVHDASVKYADFFDIPIEEAESVRISEAMSASFRRDTVGASLLDRNAERVRVRAQDLMVTPHGDWAEVELHEEYVNVTPRMQELLYHFELPESAVVTGLWLGESADKSLANVFQVAPRGAAQRVYRAAVQRRFDPALLEQVGPRQYRLRVFPVLPETQGEVAQPTHVWLRLAVVRDGGRYPLPRLTERRNAFFGDTSRSLNGVRGSWPEWLPSSVDAPVTPMSERVVNVDGFAVRVAPRSVGGRVLHGERIVVVIDRSLSMQRHAREVIQALATIRATLAADNSIEVILSSAPSRGEPAVHTTPSGVGALVYYGGQSLSSMLRDLGDADLTLVLTDDDGVKHESTPEPSSGHGALWLVHMGGVFPSGYADTVTDRLSLPLSGVAATVEDALAKYSAARDGMLVDGEHVWSLATTTGALPATDGFDALAARALVRLAGFGLVQRDSHRIAVDHAIVTTVSSMIVLVTDAQRTALVAASSGTSAFERTTETGTVPPSFGFVTGVPEPEEWVFIGFVGAMLLVAVRRRSVACSALRST